MLLLSAEEIARARANRGVIEANGLKLNAEADIVVWPASPASGWLIKVGDFRTTTDIEGNFQLPPGLSGQGLLCHPGDERFATSFSVTGLSSDSARPKGLVIPITFKGPCGMNEGDAPADTFCVPSNLISNRLLAPVLARFEPPDWVRPPNQKIPSFGVIRAERGSYPPPHEYVTKGCPQDDGVKLPDRVANLVGQVDYIGSTCHYNVLDGACPNENTQSDEEYQKWALLHYRGLSNGQTTHVALFAIAETLATLSLPLPFTPEFLTPPHAVGLYDTNCLLNHKGRLCGMFLVGDVSVDTGVVTPAGENVRVLVTQGGQGSLVIHNNGAFGNTLIRRISRQGVDFVDNEFMRAQGGGVQELLHYRDEDGLNSGAPPTYLPDQTVQYRVAADAEVGTSVTYTISVDNRLVTVIFEIADVRIAPSSVTLTPNDTQVFSAEHRRQSGQQFRYEWTLTASSGTLTPANAQTVSYHPTTQQETDDTLNLRVFVDEGNGERLYGRATATIRVSETGVVIAPANIDMSPGDQRTFTAVPFGQPLGATLNYEWSSVNGLGTLTPADQNATTYRVNSGVNGPVTDTLHLRVYIQNGASRELFGEADATVRIGSSGVSWTRQSFGSFETLFQAAYGNDKFLVLKLGDTNEVLLSADGTNWQTLGLPGFRHIDTVRFLNGEFVLLGATNDQENFNQATALWTSPDGVVWTRGADTTGIHGADIAYLNGVYAIVGVLEGTLDPGLASSSNLTQWTLRDPRSTKGMRNIRALGGRFLAAGGGDLITSQNGTDWALPLSSNFGPEDIAYTGSRYVAVGPQTVLYSDDAVNWSAGNLPPGSPTFRSVDFGGGRIKAVGFDGFGKVIYNSEDGINWTADTFEARNGNLIRVVFGNGIFIAVGTFGDLFRNP